MTIAASIGTRASAGSQTLNLNLTSALPAVLTFTRAGTRNAIQGGVIVPLGSGAPAFESWGGANRGLAIEAAVTNTAIWNSDYTQAKWINNSITTSAGTTGPDGTNPMRLLTEVAATANHNLYDNTGASYTAGDRVCFSVYVRKPAGSTRIGALLRMSKQYGNVGPYAVFRIDGVPGHFLVDDVITAADTVVSNAVCGIDTLANNVYRIWLTGTFTTTSSKEFMVGGGCQTSRYRLNNGSGTASGATTNATGYAISSTVITLASAGYGTVNAGDQIFFAGDTNLYTVAAGNTNVAAGGTITLSPGLVQAIPASATAISYQTNINSALNYQGSATQGTLEIWGHQEVKASRPVGHITTNGSNVGNVAESAVFNNISWLTTTQGTFVIEHDCYEGVLIGSGVNTILSATTPGITAVAYDATNSQVVSNGGLATTGGVLTFGADIRLLSTSAASNTGHIKSIKFYSTKLTTAQLQQLTKIKPSTQAAGSLRVATRARLPAQLYPLNTAGSQTFAFRYQAKLGNFAQAKLVLGFTNCAFPVPGQAMPYINPNAVVFTSVKIERVTGVAESVAVTVAGSSTFTMAAGTVKMLSDDILPGAFTGLSNFPANTEIWIRVKGYVANTGQYYPGSRQNNNATEAPGYSSYTYNPASTTLVDSGTGPFGYSGTPPVPQTEGYCPILLGVPAAGDPTTLFLVGDSITVSNGEGHIAAACKINGIPVLEISLGGTDMDNLTYDTWWQAWLPYARVLVDAFGTNNANGWSNQFDYWNTARTVYGYDQIYSVGMWPSTSSSDSFATLANQSNSRQTAPPTNRESIRIKALRFGYIDAIKSPDAARGNATGILTGCTTNAAGYAVGATVITLAAVGSGAVLTNAGSGHTGIKFAGDSTVYKVAVGGGNANVSAGGTITLAAPGLWYAIPTVATAVTADETTNWYAHSTIGTAAGALTNAAGYAFGATTITLASAGTGTIIVDDGIVFAGDSNVYQVVTGSANVATGGTVTIPVPGLRLPIAGAVTITVQAAANINTADGVHPQPYILQRLATEAVPWLAALTVSQ